MKVGWDQVVLVPRLPNFGRDASHGSHFVVAPMIVGQTVWTQSTSVTDRRTDRITITKTDKNR